ncbi:MAG: hypothetical protein AAFX94_13430, partial [Myxococcota bacterium]
VLITACSQRSTSDVTSWQEWRGWDPECPLLVWSGGESPPDPVRWDDDTLAEGELAVMPRAWSDGRLTTLAIQRLRLDQADPYKEWLMVNAETGEVMRAVRQAYPGPTACTFTEEAVNGNRFGLFAWGPRVGTQTRSGLIEWQTDERLPRVVHRSGDASVTRWHLVNDEWLGVRQPAQELVRLGRDAPIWSSADLPMSGISPRHWNGRLVFEVGGVQTRRLMSLNREGVPVELSQRETHAAVAGNLGANRDWMVWSAAATGHSRIMARNRAATIEIAIESAQEVGGAPFIVGCDRAAHRTRDGTAVYGLESGSRQLITAPPNRRAGRILALSCTHLYQSEFERGQLKIARHLLVSDLTR